MLIRSGTTPTEGVFYDGQVFDAYAFVSRIIKSAKHQIVLIDNYIDESVLFMLAKRRSKVKATIYTGKITRELKLDIARYNKQYPPVEVLVFKSSHDRFLIIDATTIYLIGASLKDLGKKWFAFSKINLDVNEIIQKLSTSIT